MTRLIISVGAGLLLGALLGYYGQCSSGACPLTANPWRGAIVGAIIGLLFGLSGRPANQARDVSDKKVDKTNTDDEPMPK